MNEALTDARREALETVATGVVVWDWPDRSWRLSGSMQPLNARPYEWLRRRGLIHVAPVIFSQHACQVSITEAGRDALGMAS